MNTNIIIQIIISIACTIANYALIKIIVNQCLERALALKDSEVIEKCRELISAKEKEIEFYRSRCHGMDLKCEMLEEELFKLKKNKSQAK